MSKFQQMDLPFCAAYTTEPGNLRVLVQEKTLFDLTRLQRLIDTLGLNTQYQATSSLEYLERALSEQAFDLVLIRNDPTGCTVCRAAKALRASGAASILLLGDAPAAVGLNALSKGFGDYLTEIDMTEDGMRRAAFHAMRVAQAHLPVEEAADPCVPAAF